MSRVSKLAASLKPLLAGQPEKAIKELRDRLDHFDLFDETKTEQARGNPLYILGPMVYVFWLVVTVSGALLMIYYVPTTTDAFNSILHIQDTVFLGWFIRGLHKYAADALIIALALRLYRMYFNAEYKKPGELAWIVGILVLVMAMGSGITGYLLIWNQRAFWATKVVFGVAPTYIDFVPLLGELNLGKTISQVLLGGAAVGQATLTRFYSVHYGISLIGLALVEIYFYKTRLKRLNLRWRSLAVIMGLLLLVTFIFQPVEMGRRANPLQTPLPILSDWYFLGLYQQLKYMPPAPAILSQGAMPVLAMILPLLDRRRERRPGDRPFFTIVGVTALVTWIVFSILIIANVADINRDPPIITHVLLAALAIGILWERKRWGRFVPSIWHFMAYSMTITFLFVFNMTYAMREAPVMIAGTGFGVPAWLVWLLELLALAGLVNTLFFAEEAYARGILNRFLPGRFQMKKAG